MAKRARELALEILLRVDQEDSYSNLMINAVLQQNPLSQPDRALITELVYGTITHKLRIDHAIRQYVKGSMKKIEAWVLNLLRLSFYQLMYLERIPSYAIVSESVNIAKKRGHQGISRMVNGILRSYLREPEKAALPNNLQEVKRIALQYSHPEWLVARWVKQYGENVTEEICKANNEAHPLTVRVNVLKKDRDEVLRVLYPKAKASPLVPQGVHILSGGNPGMMEEFKNGGFTIQDESSMLVGYAVNPKPGMRVLDACAAPGGKTTHLAELMANEGEIFANDLHPHKQKLIQEQIERLGAHIIRTLVGDALTLPERVTGTFDRILIDAPCTGFGVIRRKPDLKWRKQEGDIQAIAEIQYQILENLAPLLKKGGSLVYSTCTIEADENERIIERFLAKHPNFRLDPQLASDLPHEDLRARVSTPGMLQILPHYWGTDGFFIARLIHASCT